MEAVAASVVAVLGTLLGAGVTHLFQQRTRLRAEEFTRDERLRQERLDAYCAYAGLVVSYRRVLVTRWFCAHENRPAEEAKDARLRSYDLRSEVQEALFRVRMLSGSPDVALLAQEVFDAVSDVHRGADAAELDIRRRDTMSLIDAFVAAAKAHVGCLRPTAVPPRPPSPSPGPGGRRRGAVRPAHPAPG
ncbi:hypothetical protein [Streptomyces sp. Act143]|uniref:hypothetical protein n=1 Tax=Streptomyces sp. Act143 TaxID=2200760 RepID=UPI0015E7F843|nr:hypothetical protein [Streptomyces sp. Act143]